MHWCLVSRTSSLYIYTHLLEPTPKISLNNTHVQVRDIIIYYFLDFYIFLTGGERVEPRTCTEMSENNTENNQLSTAPSNGGESL